MNKNYELKIKHKIVPTHNHTSYIMYVVIIINIVITRKYHKNATQYNVNTTPERRQWQVVLVFHKITFDQ